MRTTTIWIFTLCFALGLLVLGGLYIWFWDEPPVAPLPEPVPAVTEPVDPPPTPPSNIAPPTPVRPLPPSPRVAAPPAPLSPPAEQSPIPPVEEIIPPDLDDQLSELATSGLDDLQASQKVIALMATLPESNKVQAAEFLVALLPDEGYQSVVPMLTNPNTNPEVLDVLMADLLDRPNAVQLPLILDIARNSSHPGNAEAKEVLELYVEADYGDDWTAWENAAKKFIEENPD